MVNLETPQKTQAPKALHSFQKSHQFTVQSIKYVITGGASFGMHFAVYWLFSFIVHYQIATYIALFSGLGVNYVLSKHWVFLCKAPVSKKEFISFCLFTSFGFAITGIGVFIGVDIIKANDKLVQFVVAMIVFIINFIARKFFIFKND